MERKEASAEAFEREESHSKSHWLSTFAMLKKPEARWVVVVVGSSVGTMYYSGPASASLQLADSRQTFLLKIKDLSEAGQRESGRVLQRLWSQCWSGAL